MRSLNKKTIEAQSSSASRFGGVFPTDQTFACSAQLIATGNVLGNFKIQSSDDPNTEGFPVNWIDVPDTCIAITGPGIYEICKTDICSQYHRTAFIDTSGGTSTGTISINFFSHGF